MYYEELLHYFINEKYTNSINDEINEISSSGTIRSDFFGYNILTLKKREDMTQKPFSICSVINIYPLTGVINLTKFTIQSRENEYLPTNKYKFYYYLKDISLNPIYISGESKDRDINVTFEYKEIPEDMKEVTVEIYIDISPQDKTPYTLFRQVKLYKSLESVGTLDYSTTLQTLTINSEMNSDMILNAQKSLKELETDLPFAINTTFVSSNTKFNSNGTISLSPPSCTDTEYCNRRGVCYIIDLVPFCKCKPEFKGRFCQITKNNYDTLAKYSKNLSQISNYNLYNKTNFDKPNSISIELIQTVFFEFETNINFVEKFDDLQSYVDTLKFLFDKKDKGNVLQTLNKSKSLIMNMITKCICFLTYSSFKLKYDNLNEKIKTSGSFTDPKGRYYVKFINSNNQNSEFSDASQSSDSKIENSSKSKTLRRLNYNYRYNKTNRYIQSILGQNNVSRNETNAKDDNPYIILVTENKILSLTEEQSNYYKVKYNELKVLMNNIIQAFIQANQETPLRLNQEGETMNFYIDNFSISQFSEFDFKNYFKKRIDNKQSYFDAKDCIIENLAILNKDKKNLFYIAYTFYEIPIYTIFSNLLNNTLTRSHSVLFYDYAGNPIDIKCNSEILHYFSIFPKQIDFFNKFTLFPDKYEKTDSIYSNKKYMPFYIYPNGTIDHINNMNTQIDMYYRQYHINVTIYDPQLGYTNIKTNSIENSNGNSISKRSANSDNEYSSYFKYFLNQEYLVAGSKTGGEFAAFCNFSPLSGPMGNNYYLDYNQIFKCEDNYKNNLCFIMIAFLSSSYICVLIGFISFKSCFRRYKDLNIWNKDDEEQMKNDNSIFGHNRYSFFCFEDKNYLSSHLYPNKLNFDKDKNNELAEDNRKIKDDHYSNNDNNILIPVIKDLKNKVTNSKREKSKQINLIQADMVLIKNNVPNSPTEENVLDSENAGKENKILINPRVIGENNIQELDQAKETKNSLNKNGENYDTISVQNIPVNLKQRNRFYCLYHFVVFRNIYSSFIILNSPFNPKYKTFSKLIFLIYLEMLSVLLLFVFGPFDFINMVSLINYQILIYFICVFLFRYF